MLENTQVNNKILVRTLKTLRKCTDPISNRDLCTTFEALTELIDTLKAIERPEYHLFIRDLEKDLDTLASIKFHRNF